MIRSAKANWKGPGKTGTGALTTQSGVLTDTPYSFNTRFADGRGTNPEELLAAAHAGCFTMKLSFVLGAAGFQPDNIDTTAHITLDPAAGAITLVHLTVAAKVPGISQEQFDESVQDAKKNCPVSKLFNAEITLEATLEQ